MGRWFHTVMTIHADDAAQLGVIDPDNILPGGSRRMTALTRVTAGKMSCAFARESHPVVTGNTPPCNISRMAEFDTDEPAHIRVAFAAFGLRLKVIGRFG